MKHHTLHLILCATLLALLLTACTPQHSPTPAPTLVAATPTVSQPVTPLPASRSDTEAEPLPGNVEEIAFESGSFHVVGDLRLPEGTGPFPVVLFVHGSGPIDRTMFGEYVPIMERMLQAGYAAFSWDKPGTGESTGHLSSTHVYQERAQIVLDAIEVMKAHSNIDGRRIGLWGISQGGPVMALVLTQTRDVAFMICVSCPGMSGSDQAAFKATAWALCNEVPEEKADQKTRLLAEFDRARTYDTYAEYLHYRNVLKALAGLVSAPLEHVPVVSEETWQQNPTTPESSWNPIGVLEQLRIPVLAIFGDRDRSVDPLQGAYAFRQALEHAGNPKSRVELFPRAHHSMGRSSEMACPDDQLRFIEEYVKTLGYESMSEAKAAVEQDPRLHGDFLAPGYLDLIEEWLTNLPQ
jgi:pimeloyl-ACP methyl ester carboxylesterase